MTEKKKEMGKQISVDDFKALVDLYKMKPSYSLHVQDGKKYVVESWKSKSNPFIVLNSAFEFNEENISKMEEPKRKKFLNSLLAEAVEKEEYEEAAKLRDMMALS
jgi:hypothetical protein